METGSTQSTNSLQPTDAPVRGNIFLVGMMGAGKTSVGRMLAKHLGKTFYDSDHLIEQRTGVRVSLIFEIEGESGFRARESAVVEEISQMPNVVLATGGGAVLSESNRRTLKNSGTVIYLRANVRELLNRTRHDKNRPLLQTPDPKARLTEILSVREPLYSEVAHLIVDTGSQSLKSLVTRIEQMLAPAHESSL
jgi:shikimate kinase